MAGLDYIDCNECGKRLIYDGEGEVRQRLEGETLACSHCVKKLKKKIAKLEKHDRRKR
jgi:DNA-directed RNA polymerase subunit RPC12/RpoP